jgi:hypothetical protein
LIFYLYFSWCSESEGVHNPKTSSSSNELETVNIGNTTGPNKLDRMHKSSASNEHTKTDDVDALFTQDPGESKKTTGSNRRATDVNPSLDSNTPKRLNDSSISSDRHESSRTIDAKISYGRGETDLLESILANATNNTLIDRLLGCAYGQALGDAYGLSTEFETRDRVAHNYPDTSEIIPFPDYVLTGHSRRWTRGDWTDDTDQWILILDTLMDVNGDEKMFAEKLTNWIRHGYPDLGDWGGLGLGANVSQVTSFFPKFLLPTNG